MKAPQQLELAVTVEPFGIRRGYLAEEDRELVRDAIKCLEARYVRHSDVLATPEHVKNYLRLQLAGLDYEVLALVLLDSRHRVIQYREVFRGTIDGASVHVRDIVKIVLDTGAAALIAAHNHPSGDSTPSQSDIQLTKRMKQTLAEIGVRLLDHFIVGQDAPLSLAEQGLM